MLAPSSSTVNTNAKVLPERENDYDDDDNDDNDDDDDDKVCLEKGLTNSSKDAEEKH